LEERRVGLIGLEESVHELRKEREGRIKEMAALKSERDEVRIGFNRVQAQVQATEEENRRLARLMQDMGDSGEVMRLSRQLKDAQFEAEEQQGERTRIAEALKAAEAKSERLEADVKKLEAAGAAEGS